MNTPIENGGKDTKSIENNINDQHILCKPFYTLENQPQ